MRSAPPTPGGEPPLPDLVRALPVGSSRRTTRIDPDVAFPSDGVNWAGALVIVAEGTVEVACASVGSIVVAEGELFFLNGLGIVTLRAVGSAPAVLVAIERESSASHEALPGTPRTTQATTRERATIHGHGRLDCFPFLASPRA